MLAVDDDFKFNERIRGWLGPLSVVHAKIRIKALGHKVLRSKEARKDERGQK